MMLMEYRPHLKQFWFHLSKNPIRLYCGSNQSGKTTAQCVEILDRCLGARLWVLGMIEKRMDEGLSIEHAFEGLPDLLPSIASENKPFNAMIAAEDFTSAHAENIIPKMGQLLPLQYLSKKIEKIHGQQIHKIVLFNNSTIKLMSYEQDLGKYEGPTWHYVGFDEPPPERLWGAVIRGTMAKGGSIGLAFTPLKEPWTFDRIYNPGYHCETWEDFRGSVDAEVFVVTVSLDENPFLPREARDRAVANWTKEEQTARVHGRFMHLLGRIYGDWDPEIHVRTFEIVTVEPRPEGGSQERYCPWPMGLAIDPHDRRPWAIGWFVVTPLNQRIWIEEWPQDFLLPEVDTWHWGVDEYVELIRDIESGNNRLGIPFRFIQWRICDPNFGKTPSAFTGTTLQYELGNRHLFFDCDVNNDIAVGHAKVREALKPREKAHDPALYILPHCQNIRRSFSNYVWDEWSSRVDGKAAKERPKEEWKDFMDIVRYVEVYGPIYHDPTKPIMPSVDMASYANGGLGSRRIGGASFRSRLMKR